MHILWLLECREWWNVVWMKWLITLIVCSRLPVARLNYVEKEFYYIVYIYILLFVHLSVRLSVHPSICSSICLPACLPVCLSVCQSVSLSVSVRDACSTHPLHQVAVVTCTVCICLFCRYHFSQSCADWRFFSWGWRVVLWVWAPSQLCTRAYTLI